MTDRDERISAALVAEAKRIAAEALAVETDPIKREAIERRLAVYVEAGGIGPLKTTRANAT